MKITVWSALNEKTNEFEHNHIEKDWVPGNSPVPKADYQKGWPNKTWSKKFAFLKYGSVNFNLTDYPLLTVITKG